MLLLDLIDYKLQYVIQYHIQNINTGGDIMTFLNKISDSEMKVMEKLWAFGEKTAVADITSALNDDGEKWTHQTVGTFLKRLELKDMVGSIKEGKSLYYYPLMSKDEFSIKEVNGILNWNFGGSISEFLSAFSKNENLDEKEIQNLKDWLDGINIK